MLLRIAVVLVAVAAGLGGLLLTAAQRWGAPDPGPCRDTVVGVAAACVAPSSPGWALAAGAVLPAACAALVGLWLHRRRRT